MKGAICGGLLLRPGASERAAFVRALALANPAHIAWLRHQKGKAPQSHIHPVLKQDGGPWKGGAIVPRFAPGVQGVDRTVCPAGDALEFRGELRPYQVDAVDRAAEVGHGVIVAPTGAGKTVIGCGLIARVQTPAIVLVHSRDLAEQWVERIEQFLGVSPTLVGYGKKWPEDAGRVAVASLQTLARRSWWDLHEWGSQFGLVLQDEAHHAPARTYLGVLAGLRARHRYGLTATPQREDGLTPWMRWSLGPTVARIEHTALEEAGRVLRPQIQTWNAPPVELDGMESHERMRALAEDEARNGGLCTEARILAGLGHVVLVLVRLVDHAHTLSAMLSEQGLDAAAMVGEMKPADRADVLDRMRGGRVQVVVATSLADEGLDAPRISAVVLAAPTKNVGRTLQRIGRALRPAEGAPDPVVVDVVDSWGPYQGYARTRRAEYRRRGWL